MDTNTQDTHIEETYIEETTEDISTEETQNVEKTPEDLETDKTLQALEILPELMEKLELDNKQYELHIQLIETLKQVDLPDELERARENMHHVFPLTEALWLDWINDTKKEPNSEERHRKLLTLYNQAQEDYLSVNIWKSYVEYILEIFHDKCNDDMKEDDELIETTRQQLLHAVGATQYHIKQSQEIWKPYSDFELELLDKYKSPDQQKRVYNMFLSRLAVLHIDYQDTFDSFSSYISTYDNSNYESIMMQATKIYSKTKKAAEERDVFEMKLISTNYALDTFYEYIENEKVSKNMSSVNNVKALYERAILIYCLDPTLWDDYIWYLIEKGRIVSQMETITSRAIRNCPWSGILYAHRARLLEYEGRDQTELNIFFDDALNNKQLLSSMDDLVTLLLAKIDYTRRKINWDEATEDDLINIQVVFIESLDYLYEAFPETPDPYYRIEKYFAYIAETKLYQIEKARELWERIVDTHGRDTEAWIQYITFERNQENYEKCESLFKKALQKNLDNPMRLIDTWNTMEHEFGSLESFEEASLQINRKIKTFSRQWQAALTAQQERNELKERERNENEKRKKGVRRMEQKKKQKEKKATKNTNDSQEFKKPFDVKKKDNFKKPIKETTLESNITQIKEEKMNIVEEKLDTVIEEKKDIVTEEKVNTEKESVKTDQDSSKEENTSVKNVQDTPKEKEASTEQDNDAPTATNQAEASLLKRKASDDNIQQEESKKHKPEIPKKPFNPMPRAARSRRGKSLALHGSKSLGRQDVHQVKDPVVPDATSKTNDDFRNMLLNKK